jgi:hypothetical protein
MYPPPHMTHSRQHLSNDSTLCVEKKYPVQEFAGFHDDFIPPVIEYPS